ncbi:MAG: sulfite exporter TauE/SafE family protein [Oligoflexus sp.]
MEVDVTIAGVIIFFAALAGLIDSIAGGGGLITLPMYLAVGVPVEAILGTNKAVSTAGTSLAVFRYLRSGVVYWRLLLLMMMAAGLGSAWGAKLSFYQTKESLFIFLLLAMLALVFIQPLIDRRSLGLSHDEIAWTHFITAFFLSSLVGMYDGFFGPGTGTFLIAGMIMWMQMSYQQAGIHGRVVNLSSNLGALLVFGMQQRIDLHVAAIALVGTLIGNWLGSGLALKQADRIVRPVFRIVVFALLLKCLFDLMDRHWQ